MRSSLGVWATDVNAWGLIEAVNLCYQQVTSASRGNGSACFLGHMDLDQLGSGLEGGNVCPTLIYILVPRSWEALGTSLCLSQCLARRLLGTMGQIQEVLFTGLVTEGAMTPGSRASLGLGTALP